MENRDTTKRHREKLKIAPVIKVSAEDHTHSWFIKMANDAPSIKTHYMSFSIWSP